MGSVHHDPLPTLLISGPFSGDGMTVCHNNEGGGSSQPPDPCPEYVLAPSCLGLTALMHAAKGGHLLEAKLLGGGLGIGMATGLIVCRSNL